MNKYKIGIEKKNLSWEKKVSRKCDVVKCNEIGSYKAPKSRVDLNQYYFFCLKHIKEYNKSWDFYKGLSVDQIELSMRNDTIWDRPTWPIGSNPTNLFSQINSFINEQYSVFDDEEKFDKFFQNKNLDKNLTKSENKAIEILGLSLPLNLDKIKKKYKKLVKIFHPDVNGNNKLAENKFKEISESYRILLKKFVK